MFCQSLLLLLLGVSCLQSFIMAHNSNGPETCCFNYQRTPIPIRVITGYNVTDPQCTKPGVIFTLKNSHHVCVDPEIKWVQNHMKSLDKILNERLNKPQTSVTSSLQQ
ncbi:C-C motif chemokine 3-like, partial [Silurus asotus]